MTIPQILDMMLRMAGIGNGDFIRPGVYPYRPRERFSLAANTQTPPGGKPRIPLEEGLRELLAERRARV